MTTKPEFIPVKGLKAYDVMFIPFQNVVYQKERFAVWDQRMDLFDIHVFDRATGRGFVTGVVFIRNASTSLATITP